MIHYGGGRQSFMTHINPPMLNQKLLVKNSYIDKLNFDSLNFCQKKKERFLMVKSSYKLLTM